jgi:hypothetical protein
LKVEVQIVYLITSKQHKPAAFTLHDNLSIQTWAEAHSCYAQNVLSFDETHKVLSYCLCLDASEFESPLSLEIFHNQLFIGILV